MSNRSKMLLQTQHILLTRIASFKSEENRVYKIKFYFSTRASVCVAKPEFKNFNASHYVLRVAKWASIVPGSHSGEHGNWKWKLQQLNHSLKTT